LWPARLQRNNISTHYIFNKKISKISCGSGKDREREREYVTHRAHTLTERMATSSDFWLMQQHLLSCQHAQNYDFCNVI
jgi:hypothetical protein